MEKVRGGQAQSVNELATKTVLEQVSNILCWFNIVKKKYELVLSQDLKSNKLLKNDVEITPYLPFVGLATGGMTVGKYMAKGYIDGEEEEEPSKGTPPKPDNDSSTEENDQKE